MALVGSARPSRIEGAKLPVQSYFAIQGLVFPPDALEIVVILAHVARPDRRALLGIDDTIERGHGAIVEEWRRRPNAVEGRSVVALDVLEPRLAVARIP